MRVVVLSSKVVQGGERRVRAKAEAGCYSIISSLTDIFSPTTLLSPNAGKVLIAYSKVGTDVTEEIGYLRPRHETQEHRPMVSRRG